jgi:hypothetical protein
VPQEVGINSLPRIHNFQDELDRAPRAFGRAEGNFSFSLPRAYAPWLGCFALSGLSKNKSTGKSAGATKEAISTQPKKKNAGGGACGPPTQNRACWGPRRLCHMSNRRNLNSWVKPQRPNRRAVEGIALGLGFFIDGACKWAKLQHKTRPAETIL